MTWSDFAIRRDCVLGVNSTGQQNYCVRENGNSPTNVRFSPSAGDMIHLTRHGLGQGPGLIAEIGKSLFVHEVNFISFLSHVGY